jgi:hypothetical protein
MSQINDEILGWVRYPNEPPAGFDDRIPYDDVAEGFRADAHNDALPSEVREMAVATLAELERRWADRQETIAAVPLGRRMGRRL